jgi:hypothetical protein
VQPQLAGLRKWASKFYEKVSINLSYKSEEKLYKGTPLPRDSVTPLKPPWVMNHPVA